MSIGGVANMAGGPASSRPVVGPYEQSIHGAIEEALWKHASGVEHRNRRTWTCVLQNGRPLRLLARLDLAAGWLALDGDVGTNDLQDAWRLLNWNGAVVGAGRIVLLPRERLLRLRAELAIDEEVDLGARIGETCAGFRELWSAFHGHAGPEDSSSETLAESEETAHSADLAAGCAATGWRVYERAGNRLAIDLEVPGRFYQAMVEGINGDGVRVWTELVRWPAEPPAGVRREALAMLLLASSSAVRLARAAAAADNGASVARFEVRFETAPVAAELHHALSALAAACLLCGEEARALQNDHVAENYLATRGRWLEASREEP